MPPLKKLTLPLSVFVFVAFMLSMAQLKAPKGMLMLERFFSNGGWVEIIAVTIYGAVVAYFMQDVKKAPKWRMISWTIFSVFFFAQLILGILVSDKFLLTGKLHIPVPAMMISGPIYRGQLSIMTLLFLSTIVLSGPAWCSHLCYFGAVDGIAASKKKGKLKPIIKHLQLFKGSLLIIVITTTLLFRWFNVNSFIATIAGISFGLIGLLIILFLSPRKGKMTHCIAYCPIGTVVNFLKPISPFRMYIEKSTCTLCMHCTPACKYDALNLKDLQAGKPSSSCTLCGDCLSACNDNSIHYKFFQAKPKFARMLYLFITISLHAMFLAMGRI